METEAVAAFFGNTAAREFTVSFTGAGGIIDFSDVTETAGMMFFDPLATACVTAVDAAEERATKLNIFQPYS